MFNLNDIPIVDAEKINQASPYPKLIKAIVEGFQKPPIVPDRSHHNINDDVTLLSMPSWITDEFIGHKLVNIGLGNAIRELNTTHGLYLLFDAQTGIPLAIMDAAALTARRTAAVAACASDILACQNASSFLMVGTGRLAREFIEAHALVRNYDEIFIWGRDFNKAEKLCDEISTDALKPTPVKDIQLAVSSVDVISCATTSTAPIIYGEWLKDGVHLDLAGSFKSHMVECDDGAIKCSKVYVDNHLGALKEAGEIVQAIDRGVIKAGHIVGDLTDLVTGGIDGRLNDTEITLFKSIGTAIADYSIAKLVYSQII